MKGELGRRRKETDDRESMGSQTADATSFIYNYCASRSDTMGRRDFRNMDSTEVNCEGKEGSVNF